MAGVTISATIQGGDSAVRKFRALESAVRTRIAKTATRAGLKPQRSRAKATTRFTDRTGKLRAAMGLSVRSRRRGELTIGRVLIKRTAPHGMPVEYGHRIAVDRASGRSEKNVVLRRKDGRPKKLAQRYGVSAGRVEGRHYLRDAFERSTRSAEQEFSASFVREVNGVANG